jgi:hypothetical protein
LRIILTDWVTKMACEKKVSGLNMKLRIILLLLGLPLMMLIAINMSIPDYYIAVAENPQIMQTGAPALPYLSVKILLPMGEKAENVEVYYRGNLNQLDLKIEPVVSPQPLSQNYTMQPFIDEEIFGRDADYPEVGFTIVGTGRKNGCDILYLHLYPWRYNPQIERLSWYDEAEIELETSYSEEIFSSQNSMLLANKEPELHGQNTFDLSKESYTKSTIYQNRNLADPSEPYSMVLITSYAGGEWFNDFINWKAGHGIETGVFFKEDIYTEYAGENNQAKIKNFITDAYLAYSGTNNPLEYVILGGDDEIIPIRGVYINAGGTIDNNLPCDLYYSCLDNDWDGNGNGIYGEEEDNVDMLPELAISRIPVDNEQDVTNWFYKLVHYVDNNTYSNNICYMLGEFLWGNPDTWGGDSMDLLLEVMTDPGHVETMYQRDGTYSEYGVTLAINGGLGFINHLGHANENFVFGQTLTHAAGYNNTEYGFAYSQGCYPAAFDELTGQASECIAENFIIKSGGLFGFIGNTRYGWGIPGQPANGPSQRYHLPFIEAIYEHEIREFGKALAYSRDVMADAALQYMHLRWVHYELVLFGDPSIQLKEPNPDFPFLFPENPIYSDTEGDGDGAINPGETIEITIPITAASNWADAQEVTISIIFQDSSVTTETETIYYGSIQSGETIISEPIIVQVPEDCNYEAYPYTITIHSPVGTESAFMKTYDFDFEVSIHQIHWPWYHSQRLSVAPIIYDLDGNGEFDILSTTMSGNMYGLDIFTEELADYPVMTGETIEKHTSMGDVDNDGEPEIVMATRAGNIYARNLDGSIAWQFSGGSDHLLTPLLADIDGDGLLETVSYSMDGNVHALDENGMEEAGFPLQISQLCIHEMAAADLDGDGAADLAIATLNGELSVYSYNGMQPAGFPVDLGAAPASGITILDNCRLVLGTSDSRLLVISSSGEIITDKSIDSNLASSPIAADFSGNGELDLGFTTRNGSVYICSQDGEDLSGWPIYCGYPVSQPPLAVDMNNDDLLDIIWFSSNNTLFVYNNDGSELDFSPVPLNYNDNFPASIADLDNDLDYEIVLSTGNRIVVIDSKLRKGNLAPWSTYRGNLQRTGFYNDNQLSDSYPNEVIVPQNRLLANYPNPFNPETTILFELSESSSQAVLNIYNVKGQKVFGKTFSNPKKGRHEMVWQGIDERGSSAASGIYFYQLQVDGANFNARRMLLLK